MMKFSLVANNMQQDGFKILVSAENPEEVQVVKGLTEKLIEKISFIEIKQQNFNEDM